VARNKPTDRKREILSILKAATESGGHFPTPAQLQMAVDCITPPHIVHQLTVQKRKRGFVAASDADISRMTLVPIYGAIPAGYGDSTEPTELGSIPVDLEALSIKPSSRTFALKVRGDSMIGAQISDGDLVIIEAREPKIGDIVAALIDGETTLKRFVTEDGRLFLKAENPNYPNLIPLQELIIQGVVRAVVRVCERSRIAA
jgi:repressor LexA